MEVVAYDKMMLKRNPMFAYHLFDLNLAELERSRRFELKVSRLSYWRDHLRVQLWIYPILSFKNVTRMLMPRGRTSFAA